MRVETRKFVSPGLWAFGATILFIGAITTLGLVYRDELIALSGYGYLGILIACLVANSTVMLPAPSTGIVFAAAMVYPPFPVALFGAAGATLGEVLGYLAGYTGRSTRPEQADRFHLQDRIAKYGYWAVFLFALLPLPIFDIVGLVSGAGKMKFGGFLFACFVGKLIKMAFYAFLATGILHELSPIIVELLTEK